MPNKIMNARVSHMHDKEENWLKAITFIPHSGEIIVYDADEHHPNTRIKIGDGVTLVNDLPFVIESTLYEILAHDGDVIYMDAGNISDYSE